MNEMNAGKARPKTPVHLWIVGVVSLLWNFMGAFDYLATQLKLEFYMSNFTPEQLDYFYGFPSWVVAFWAFGVWGALAGSILLLMRKKWAFYAFALSIFGLFVSSIYNYFFTDGFRIMGSTAIFMSVFIWVISVFLLWYSWSQTKKGVLT